MVSPLLGVIFLFKYRRSEFAKMQAAGADKPLDGTYETVSHTLTAFEASTLAENTRSTFFARQVIQNACATQAVLSLLMNLQPEDNEAAKSLGAQEVDIGEQLTNFKLFVDSFDSEMKGEVLTNSEEIREAHNSFSRPTPFFDDKNDDKDKDRDEENDGLYHFIAYKPINGLLYEFDGLHPAPIVHNDSSTPCTVENFPQMLSEVLHRRIDRAPEGDLRFNLLALTSDRRPLLAAAGDIEGLHAENEKREAWKRENNARRANYTELLTELIKGIASDSDKFATDSDWNKKVVAPAREKSKKQYYESIRHQGKLGFEN